jgi:hypothetical protein
MVQIVTPRVHTASAEVGVQQEISAALKDALLEVAKLRPKHPVLSSPESAMKFIAIHLKAHNPRLRESAKSASEAKLNDFTSACSLGHSLLEEMRPELREADDAFAVDAQLTLELVPTDNGAGLKIGFAPDPDPPDHGELCDRWEEARRADFSAPLEPAE